MQEEELLRVTWKSCANLPVAISSPQVVRIGDEVFVSGGMRNRGSVHNVLRYSVGRDVWSVLPDCPTRQHALASLAGELVAVGGRLEHTALKTVLTFRDDTWQELLPPMPTARYSLSTISYEGRIVVAIGGVTSVTVNEEYTRSDEVEMYVKDNQWYSTKRLPFPTSVCSTAVVGETCYVLGGIGNDHENCCTTLYATISSLLKEATPPSAAITSEEGHHHQPSRVTLTWKKFPDKHPLTFPSLVELDERLVTMGGSLDPTLRHGTRLIGTYNFVSHTWVKCKYAEIPLPLYRSGLETLDNNQVLVVGGQSRSQKISAAVFLGSYQTC